MAGGTIGGGDDDGLVTEINVTPLVDVVLVLLIILMVTATAIVSKTIQMDLPEAATGESQPDEPSILAVSIDADGQLYLDRDPLDADELRQRIRAASQTNMDLRAIIAADGALPHRNVVQVIDLLRQEQVTKFAINVRPGDLDSGSSMSGSSMSSMDAN